MDLDHEHEYGLNPAVYNDIVTAACEAATLAVLRAMQSQAVNPSRARGSPVPPDHPNSDGNELETGILVAFERMCPRGLTGCVVVTPL
jgi:hypothetical protein